SAASVIAMAGDVIEIAPSASMMIHRAWGAVIGNTTDMQEFAGVLAQIDDALAGVYAARAGIKPADALGLMDAETWFFGQGAVDAGFADRVAELPEASAMIRGHRPSQSLREPAQPVAQQDDARLVAALRGLQQTITR
ncbi:MAG TPA: hypothetical protein DCO82_04370, partial [Alphaproteobacteria bacterium]|nr:hypothetical protein [Alphaproteobacteria bacterium]